MVAPQGQEWPRMDNKLVLAFVLELDLSCGASGVLIFSGFSEFWLFRQAKAKNSDEYLILQIFGKLFLHLHSRFLS